MSAEERTTASEKVRRKIIRKRSLNLVLASLLISFLKRGLIEFVMPEETKETTEKIEGRNPR